MVKAAEMVGPARPRRRVSVQKCMAYTYYNLRYGLAGAAAVFPIVLAMGENLMTQEHVLPGSISGYYHTGMRNYFVATLVTLGVFLVLYRGFSLPESWILNIAGAAVMGVAFLPTGRDPGSTDPADTFTAPHWHGFCALLAFGSMAVVTWFFGPRTLDLINPQRRGLFRWIYRLLALGMLILPLLCLLAVRGNSQGLFALEWVALWVFVGYWITKTIEFRMSKAETRAIDGELEHAATRGRLAPATIVPAGAP
jgi:hypothetical protein